MAALYPIPNRLREKLEVACYDCHSNQTRYPWYAEVQPIGWWLDQHVRDGKAELNFSEFGLYSTRRKIDRLETLIDEVWERSMPLPSYTWGHRDAVFDEAEIDLLTDWAEALIEQLEDEP